MRLRLVLPILMISCTDATSETGPQIDAIGTWTFATGTRICEDSTTGEDTADDPGLVENLRFESGGAAGLTLADGMSVAGKWTQTPGNPALPVGDELNRAAKVSAHFNYDHGGKSWSATVLLLAQPSQLDNVTGGWSATTRGVMCYQSFDSATK